MHLTQYLRDDRLSSELFRLRLILYILRGIQFLLEVLGGIGELAVNTGGEHADSLVIGDEVGKKGGLVEISSLTDVIGNDGLFCLHLYKSNMILYRSDLTFLKRYDPIS